MKSNIFVKVLQTTLVTVVVFCISSQAFKLPINLKRSMKEIPHQDESTQLQVDAEENLGKVKVLFPEKTDGEDDKDYQTQLSFKSQDEIPEEQTMNGENVGLERFYKYNLKAQPSVDQVIVFPKEANRNTQTQRFGENEEDDSTSRSGGNLSENITPGTKNEDSENNSRNATNFSQSLDYLAQMVYQLLFREPKTEIVSPVATSGTSSTEMDVQEQSLYSGPKFQTQSSNSECPDGTKRNRNGSCQKPSRRFSA